MKKSPLIIFFSLPLLLTSCLFDAQTCTNKKDYKKCVNEALNDGDFHTQLYILPNEITQDEIINFTYKARGGLFTGSYFFYLVAQYDEVKYTAEIARLDTVKAVFKDKGEKPLLKYDDQSLYLAIDKDNRCEYVRYNRNKKQIAYVSNQLYEWDKVDISNDHLQGEVVIPQELDDGNNSYNMYYFYEGDVGYYVTDNI